MDELRPVVQSLVEQMNRFENLFGACKAESMRWLQELAVELQDVYDQPEATARR